MINSHNELGVESAIFRTSFRTAFLMLVLKSNKYKVFILNDPGPLGIVDTLSFSLTTKWSDLYPGIILHCKAWAVICFDTRK